MGLPSSCGQRTLGSGRAAPKHPLFPSLRDLVIGATQSPIPLLKDRGMHSEGMSLWPGAHWGMQIGGKGATRTDLGG